MEIKPIAFIRNAYKSKFGVPRQSGVAPKVKSKIVFEKEYRNPDALRGLEGFSHLWIIWEFSANSKSGQFHPTVRPPRLGGNVHVGVFATRSPFRPNPLGLSCVEIDHIEEDSCTIVVNGADLMDGTPIYDIKPYIKYSDSFPDAVCGFTEGLSERKLEVVWACSCKIGTQEKEELEDILKNDPRPSYQNDPGRIYGMYYRNMDVHFTIDETGVLRIISIDRTLR